ncbi:sensor histidine kinase [Pontibacter sp. H249]|uniref:sensor histidine kinase n=1 Tax=Pontibacter sp. H249 TaxID=3133420 RepID=UPI0030C09000
MTSGNHKTLSINTDLLHIFRGGGEMGAMMRAYNWDAHPLGNPRHWPDSLKNIVRLILNSDFPMFIWWSQDLYMFHNDAYLPALGDKHPKALGASAREMWSEIWADIGGVTENILENGESFYAENMLLYLMRKGFSEETYWTFSYSPAFDDQGEVAGMFCACNEETKYILGQRRLRTLKDISDNLSQAQTLEQLSATAKEVLEQNSNDLPFSMVYLANSIGSEATLVCKTGCIKDDLVPATINLKSLEAEWPAAKVLQSLQSMVVELPEKIKDSCPDAPSKAIILPILKPGGDHCIGFFISGISEKQEYNEAYEDFHNLLTGQIATSIANVQARQEILKRQEYLNDIFEQAPVGITMLRGSNYIVDIANPGVCEIWRVEKKDVLGKPIMEVLPEAEEQGFKALLDGVMATGTPFVANELPLVLERNGEQETLFLNFVYHPLRDDQGFVTGIIAVAIDISEQLKARQEIESMNKELLATNADLDNFVYSASHDLKAPIHNIEGLVHALMDCLPADLLASEDVQQLTSHIQSSVNRFKKVVLDLTKVATIQREANEDVSTINLNQVIEETLLDFKPEIVSSGATFEMHLTQEAAVNFSEKNIRSIIYNLISNALKYKSPVRTPRITISTETTPEHLILTITDNGLGIKISDKDKMFSMFKRLHDHVEGSGIGLYIVKKIIENAGGRIEVESELEKGTTFKVNLKR